MDEKAREDYIKRSFVGIAEAQCNEIDADTHGLPILLLPDNENARWGDEIEGDSEVLKKWKKDHPKGTVLEKSKQWRFK